MISIEIAPRGDRIHLRSPYSPDTVTKCKKVPGANWAKSYGVWTFPLTIESCVLLRQHFGPALRVHNSVSDWFRAERARRDGMASLGATSGANLERIPEVSPVLAKAMEDRPYQPVGARFIAEGRSVLVADDPGLGKTLEAIGGVIESGVPGPYLVVCPKTAVESVWAREIPRWWPEQRVITVPDGKALRESILNDFLTDWKMCGVEDLSPVVDYWVAVHPEMLLAKVWWVCDLCGAETKKTTKPTPVLDCGHDKTSKVKTRMESKFPQLFEVEWGAVILDECHKVLIRKSANQTQRRTGAELLQVREDGLRVALSGTPMRGKPHQLWGTLNWLRPKIYSGFWRWAQTFWNTGGYSGWELGDMKEGAEPLLWDSLKDVILRRTKGEVAADLPPKTYVGSPLDASDPASPVGIWLPMEPAQEKVYKQMLSQSVATLEGGDLSAVGVLAELTRLKQFASACGSIDSSGEFFPNPPSNKFNYVEELLEELGIPDDPTGKVVIVSQFTRLLLMFSFGLTAAQNGMGCMLTGAVSGKRRAETIDRFNQPARSASPHIMFLQVHAGGEAITIDSADDMVMLDEADSDTMTQVEDRIHRVSNPRPVRYHYLRSVGTVDVGTALANAGKLAQTTRLLDERRGVIHARAILEASR